MNNPSALELAFVVQDPCGDAAICLAAEALTLIRDRDDIDARALASEFRALGLKYPRYKPQPIGGNDASQESTSSTEPSHS